MLDYRQVAAVNTRLELDLRIGAAFTRFQTLTLQQRVGAVEGMMISYGNSLGILTSRIMSISDAGIYC